MNLHDEAVRDFILDVGKRKAALQTPHLTDVDLVAHIEYHFTPGERRTHGHPGQEASAEVIKVTLPGLSMSGSPTTVDVELPREVVRWLSREIIHG